MLSVFRARCITFPLQALLCLVLTSNLLSGCCAFEVIAPGADSPWISGRKTELRWHAEPSDPLQFDVELWDSGNITSTGRIQIARQIRKDQRVAQVQLPQLPSGTYKLVFAKSQEHSSQPFHISRWFGVQSPTTTGVEIEVKTSASERHERRWSLPSSPDHAASPDGDQKGSTAVEKAFDLDSKAAVGLCAPQASFIVAVPPLLLLYLLL